MGEVGVATESILAVRTGRHEDDEEDEDTSREGEWLRSDEMEGSVG